MIDLLEGPDGAPYPDEVQEFLRTLCVSTSGEQEQALRDDLVLALESVAKHWRDEHGEECNGYYDLYEAQRIDRDQWVGRYFAMRQQVARLGDVMEHGALRWEDPLRVPGYVEDIDKILAGQEIDPCSPTCTCKWHEGERGRQRELAVLDEHASEAPDPLEVRARG